MKCLKDVPLICMVSSVYNYRLRCFSEMIDDTNKRVEEKKYR